MKFEDIVDMDWLNSNTTTGDSLPQSPVPVIKEEHEGFSSMTDYYPDDLYGQEPDLLWQHDIQPMTIDSPCSPASSSASSHTDKTPVPPAAVPDLIDPKNAHQPQPVGFVMPTTDQIKLLIEEAKRQLALREEHQRMHHQHQQQQQQQPHEVDEQHNLKQEPHESEQLVSEKNVSPTTFENTCDPMTLFGAAAAAAAATVPDTISPESLMKGKQRRHSPSPSPSPSPARRESSVSASTVNDEAMTLEAYAESDGIDIKKLTPKERRQLRNKISARNFRVRRKEYITTLEAQVDDHKRRADRLQVRLDNVEEENKQLRLEVDSLKRENQLLQQKQQHSSSATAAAAAASSSELTRQPQSPRVSSPLPKPNLNKDISMLGSKASDTYRQDSRILVSNAVMPAWNFDRIFAEKTEERPSLLPEPPVLQCAAYILTCFVQLTQSSMLPSKQVHDAAVPFEETKEKEWTAPLLPDERDFSTGDDKQQLQLQQQQEQQHEEQEQQSNTVESPAYMEYLYDTLIMSALMTNAQTGSYVTDKSFWWWDTPTL
ncbi:hypothetical protein BCR43DRAFT_528202 [Syncephalastrum racemosum]|uniref:BZIP domain-containing protein n=1 Tax=Syncephalastrum racemosum TaxID=13706 RepID=A0A1X2H0I7_SYNRA|nr:hypothetical protein BCR43DRAFT_528202 [Syncephalastrum racemosum]